MIHKNLILRSSNKNKINEFEKFGLDFKVEKGKDIKEIDGSIDKVILYKALDSGDNILVDDTVLMINGEEIVDIKWKLKELIASKDPVIEFVVSLGIKDNDHIYIYQSKVKCELVKNANDIEIPKNSFGFDPFLIPIINNNTKSYHELEQAGQKDDYSPRKRAVENLLQGNYKYKTRIMDIPVWNGGYQSNKKDKPKNSIKNN